MANHRENSTNKLNGTKITLAKPNPELMVGDEIRVYGRNDPSAHFIVRRVIGPKTFVIEHLDKR